MVNDLDWLSVFDWSLDWQQSPYATHIPVLQKVVKHTVGPILEVGGGDYSTEYLSHLDRELWTVEPNDDWREVLKSRYRHKIVPMLSDLPERRWPVVFMDQDEAVDPDMDPADHPMNRRLASFRLLDFEVGVLHDLAERMWENYRMEARYKWADPHEPSTTVFSETVDVREWF